MYCTMVKLQAYLKSKLFNNGAFGWTFYITCLLSHIIKRILNRSAGYAYKPFVFAKKNKFIRQERP